MITIDSKDIREAERFLLPSGCCFDEERVRFISYLNSADLMAVPGSGKTTALQAKLYCLAKSLPFKDGSGILVLSHTNAAVEEIKAKLSFNAPQLFSYPCAIVTLQEFIDRFLALPYYASLYKTSPRAIEDVRYYNAVEKYINAKGGYIKFFHENDKSKLFFNARFIYNVATGKGELAANVDGDALSFSFPPTWEKIRAKKEEEIKQTIKAMKIELIKEGILHYDDCYFLANAYIGKRPGIVSFLRKRFPFVFIDETQDLKKYQLEIIDELFNVDGVVLQRIGDQNQAIFSGGGEQAECDWTPRKPLTLSNSLRLSVPIAKVVSPFMLYNNNAEGGERYAVNGVQPNSMNLPPFLILYDSKDGGTRLKAVFRSLIQEFHLDQHPDAKRGFYIIGWGASFSAPAEGERKPRLEDIFKDYTHRPSAKKNAQKTLSEFISSIESESSPGIIKEELLNAICRALFVSGQDAEHDNIKRYTPSSFYAFVKEVSTESSNLLDLSLYNAVNLIRGGEKDRAYRIIKDYIENNALSLVMAQKTHALKDFLGEEYIGDNIEESANENEGEHIRISTVHSAKGQTHCATMYVETSFRGKFETEWLIKKRVATKRNPSTVYPSPFFGDGCQCDGDSAKKAMKMLYVGLSRPLHMLCYASWRSLWTDEMIEKMKGVGWQILDVK